MPDMNRRSFFQVLGAASLAPFLPALPAQPAAAASGASVSKALWSGIYAKSGSASGFVHTARGMGLPATAIEGVSAKSVGVRVLASGVQGSLSQTKALRLKQVSQTHPHALDFTVSEPVEREDSQISFDENTRIPSAPNDQTEPAKMADTDVSDASEKS